MKGEKIKLLLIIPNLTGGGAERALVNLYKGLKNYEIYDLYVVLFQNLKKYDEILNEDLIILNTPGSRNPLGKIKNFFKRIYLLSLIKKKISPDLSISFLEGADFLNLLTKNKNHKVIIVIHSYMTKLFKEDYNDGIIKKILRKVYSYSYKILSNKADLIICVSKGIADDFIKNYNIDYKKIKIIYNPIQVEIIKKLKNETLYNYEPIFKHPVLITVGRLTKAKGHWYLLRILKILKEKHKDLKLVILGEGELKDYLVKLSEELGLKTFVWDRDELSESFDVYFLGFQKNPFKFIARSNLFVFSSLWEGFGNVLIESMACGIPIISSDCRSGPREILAPNTDFNYQTQKPEFAEYGVLMPVFDVIYKTANEPLEKRELMWGETIDRLLEDGSLRKHYSERAKQRAEDFGIEKITEEWNRCLIKLKT
jgi:glycosyltransferase involved in cell wall biosynthesis